MSVINVIVQDMLDALIQIGFERSDIARLRIEYRGIAGGAYQLDYHKHHYFGVFDGVRRILDYHIVNVGKVNVFFICLCCDSSFKNAPAQILGYEMQQCLVLCQLVDDIVDDKDYIRFKVMIHFYRLHLQDSLFEQL